MAASTFRALYTIGGGSNFTKSYGIASSEAWSIGSVVALNSDGALLEPTADNVDVLGISLETVAAGAATAVVTDKCVVQIFDTNQVFAVKEAANLANVPATTDIGNIRDLDLDGTNGWGILDATAATAATPQFRIIDIDTVRLEWHVVIAPLEISDVFQFTDALV